MSLFTTSAVPDGHARLIDVLLRQYFPSMAYDPDEWGIWSYGEDLFVVFAPGRQDGEYMVGITDDYAPTTEGGIYEFHSIMEMMLFLDGRIPTEQPYRPTDQEDLWWPD